MKNNNSYSELEHLELVARRIAESGIDITSQYKDWITVTLPAPAYATPTPASVNTGNAAPRSLPPPTTTPSYAPRRAPVAIWPSTSRRPSTWMPFPCPTREPTPRHSICSTTVSSRSPLTRRASSLANTTSASRNQTTARKPSWCS